MILPLYGNVRFRENPSRDIGYAVSVAWREFTDIMPKQVKINRSVFLILKGLFIVKNLCLSLELCDLSLCIIILKGKCILHFAFVPDVSVLTLSCFKMLTDANHLLLIFEIMGSVHQFVQILSRSGYIY